MGSIGVWPITHHTIAVTIMTAVRVAIRVAIRVAVGGFRGAHYGLVCIDRWMTEKKSVGQVPEISQGIYPLSPVCANQTTPAYLRVGKSSLGCVAIIDPKLLNARPIGDRILGYELEKMC